MRVPFLSRFFPDASEKRPDREQKAAEEAEKIRQATAKVRLAEREVELEAKRLRNRAIERTLQESVDPLEALEVVAVTTHRGRGAAPMIPRRKPPEPSAMEAMGMKLLEAQMTNLSVQRDPMEMLERAIDLRTRVDEVADELVGGGRAEPREAGWAGVLERFAESPLAEAIGTAIGYGMQARASAPLPLPAPVPTPDAIPIGAVPPIVSRPMPTAPLPSIAEQFGSFGEPATPLPPPATPPPTSVERPISLRAGLAIAQLKRKTPEKAADWILQTAETSEALGEMVDQLLLTEPDELIGFLQDSADLAARDPINAEWAPVLLLLVERTDWTLQVHAALRSRTAEDEVPTPSPEDLATA